MNLGPTEIMMLVLLGVLMFGPEKLPPVARKVGRVYRYLSGIANEAKDQLGKELGPGFQDLSLADLNPKTFLTKHLLDAGEVDAVREALSESKQALSDGSAELASATAGIASGANELLGALNGSEDGVLVTPAGVPFDLEAT